SPPRPSSKDADRQVEGDEPQGTGEPLRSSSRLTGLWRRHHEPGGGSRSDDRVPRSPSAALLARTSWGPLEERPLPWVDPRPPGGQKGRDVLPPSPTTARFGTAEDTPR